METFVSMAEATLNTSTAVVKRIDPAIAELIFLMENLHITEGCYVPVTAILMGGHVKPSTAPFEVKNIVRKQNTWNKYRDPVRRLEIFCQARQLSPPEFNCTTEETDRPRQRETCEVKMSSGRFCSYGVAASQTLAKRIAAKVMYQTIKGHLAIKEIIQEEERYCNAVDEPMTDLSQIVMVKKRKDRDDPITEVSEVETALPAKKKKHSSFGMTNLTRVDTVETKNNFVVRFTEVSDDESPIPVKKRRNMRI